MLRPRGQCVVLLVALAAAATIGPCTGLEIDKRRFGGDLVRHLTTLTVRSNTPAGDVDDAEPADQGADALLHSAYVALYERDDTSEAEAKARECLRFAAAPARVECLLVLLEILEREGGLSIAERAIECLDAVADFFETLGGVHLLTSPSDWRRIFSKYFLALHSLNTLHGVWVGSVHLDVFEAIRNRTRWIHPWQTPDGQMYVDDPAIEGPSKAARPFWPATEFPDTRRLLEEQVFPAIVDELPAAEALWQEHFETELKSGHASTWQEIRLYEMSENMWSEKRCATMSKTCAALQRVVRLMQRVRPVGDARSFAEGLSVPGRLSLLRLPPGSSLVTHTGSANVRLSFHMGVQLPPPEEIVAGVQADGESATLAVGNRTVRWSLGKVIFWDDSFVHSVRNDHPSVARIVFTGHFFKPALTGGHVVVHGQRWEVIPVEGEGEEGEEEGANSASSHSNSGVKYGLVEDERRVLQEV